MTATKTMVRVYMLLLVAILPSLGLSSNQFPIHQKDDTPSVPGTNPLRFCASPSAYILNLGWVDLVPNPPQTGTTLTIKASGNVTQRIEDGAHAKVAVKLKLNFGGLIPIVTRDANICELLDKDEDIKEKCPVEKDEDITITKTVDIPAQVPKGKYVVLIDAYTKDEEQITCLQAEIAF